MEGVWAHLDRGKFLFTHFNSFRVLVCVQLALHAQSGFRGGGRDQVDDDFMAHQRFAAPVFGDEGE